MTSHRMRYKIGLTEYNVAIKDIDASGNGGEIPLGIILPFASNGNLPSGFLLCDGSAVSREMYPDLFAAIGTLYGEGDGETTFNLPDLEDLFLQGGSLAGVEKEAGLPNIEGKFSYVFGMGYNNDSGCLSTTKGSGFSYGGSSVSSYATVKVDASQSNAIYGNSNTVQPPALTVKYIIKAFSAVTQDSQLVDITQYASALNGKPSKSLNDLTSDGEDHFLNRDFVIIYPNGGTAQNPASISGGSNRYIESNPFPGYVVRCSCEVYYNGEWGDTGWYTYYTTNSSHKALGARAYQLNDSNIVIQTGDNTTILFASHWSGNPFGTATSGGVTSLPCRVKVWKVGKLPT